MTISYVPEASGLFTPHPNLPPPGGKGQMIHVEAYLEGPSPARGGKGRIIYMEKYPEGLTSAR